MASSNGGGCTCRYREEEPLALAFAEQLGGGGGGGGGYRRPYAARGTGHVCGPLQPEDLSASDRLLPLSQQMEPSAAAADGGGGGGGGGGAGKRARRARGHLKSRQWSRADILEGMPLKFTVAEALRRACDRVRVLVAPKS